MKTRKWALIVSVVLALALSLGGTLAYLQDTDEDVNVMTLGDVHIEQHEKERVEQSDDNTSADNLTNFTDHKLLYPYTGENVLADEAQQWPDGSSDRLYSDAMTNVVDKIVYVENNGESEAYVRTWLAFEQPVGSADELPVGVLWNEEDWTYEIVAGNIAYGDGNYLLVRADYKAGALPAGEMTPPSLMQVYLDKTAGNAEVEALDTNGNGEYDIMVISQGVQTAGFADADTALSAAFLGGADAASFDDYEVMALGWFEDADEVQAEEEANRFADKWDGTADTTWYNDTDTDFTITTAEQLAGLGELVDAGKSFAGKTLTLGRDIDLGYVNDAGNRVSFSPIGDKSAFSGTFDGDDHKIMNMYQSGWDFGYQWGSYGSIGLFGNIESGTVRELTITGAELQIEGGDVALITGSATGTCVFEDITLEDSKVGTYNNGLGGIIGWSGAGNYTFKDITVGDNVVLAGLWGSFDSSIGGIVGQAEPGATYDFENVEISCRLDVYNDCTASYDYYNYRMCGMIMGRLERTTTIDGANYPDTTQYNITCENVTVNYGDWMNYHYCEPTPADMNGGRGMRVEAGFTYGGLPEDYDHSQCVANHMNLIPFDQIFGGAQYGVKGLKTFEGVTVNYPQ